MDRKLAGRWGEAQAAKYLRDKGYELIGAGYRTRFGEIDLLAKKGSILAFVEVKLRKDDKFAEAREFVDDRKQRRIRSSADIWLSDNDVELQPRFDVIEIYAPEGTGAPPKRINHIENAF